MTPQARKANQSYGADDYSWQEEFAPKVTRGRVYFAFAVFGIWILGMIAIAVHRWFVSLQ
jgi:hypothetical protein